MRWRESAKKIFLEQKLSQSFLKVTVEKRRSLTARGNFGWVVRWVERVTNREVVIIVLVPSLNVRTVEELVQICSIVKVPIF